MYSTCILMFDTDELHVLIGWEQSIIPDGMTNYFLSKKVMPLL